MSGPKLASRRSEAAEPETFSIALVRRLCGHETAAKLVLHHGGQRLYIAAKAEGSVVERTVGTEAARLLCAEFGGCMVSVPRNGAARLQALTIAGTRDGLSAGQIAQGAGCTERRIQQIRQSLRAAGAL